MDAKLKSLPDDKLFPEPGMFRATVIIDGAFVQIDDDVNTLEKALALCAKLKEGPHKKFCIFDSKSEAWKIEKWESER